MKKIIKDWKYVLIFLPLIVLLGLVFRLYHLNSLPVFADEAIYIRWAQVMRAESTLRFLPLSDGKQPLFMWTVIPFLKLINDPLVAGRAVSIACGIVSLVGIFLLTNLLFKSQKAALLAVLLYAFSPFTFFFERMALVDSMLSAFGIWTLLLAVAAAKTLRLDYAMLAGFALGGALLTKSPAIFFVILLPAVFIFVKKPIHLIKLAALLAVTYLIGYGLYNILRLGPNFHLIGSRNADYVFPLNHLWLNPKDPFIFHFDRALEWIWAMGPWPLFILAAIGLVFLFKKHKKEALFLIAWFLFPLGIQSMFAKVFTARYIFFLIPPLYILAGVSILTKRWFRRLVFGLVGLFIILSLKFNYLLATNPGKANLPRSERSGYLEEWTAGTGITEAAEYLKTESLKLKTNEKIIVGTEGYFGTLPDGLQMYMEKVAGVTVIGVGIDFGEVPKSLLDAKKAGDKVYFAANTSRLRFKESFEDLGLKVVAAYPKAFRPEGIREYVQHGPRDTFYLFEVTEKAI